MIKRFVIAAIIIAVFLGGVGYFNLVFKPKMIAEFIGKMVPPPATVTAETAKTERWTDRVHSIGTLLAIEGVDVSSQLGGQVIAYFFESGDDVQKGAKLVQLDTSVEEADLANNKATLLQANLDFERQSKLVKTGAVSEAVLDATIAKRDTAASVGGEDGCHHRREKHHRTICRQARSPPGREGAICDHGAGAGLAPVARSDLGGLPGAGGRHGQVQGGLADRDRRRRLPGQDIQGRSRGVRRTTLLGLAHVDGAGQGA